MVIASAQCTVTFGVRVGRVGERLAQALVDLDHVHVRDALGEVLREHAQAAADLEHHVLRRELGRAVDHAEDVRVDQEVLAELAVGAHAEAAHAPQAGLDGSPRPRRSSPSRTRAPRCAPRVAPSSLDAHAAQLGQEGRRVHDERGLVALACAPPAESGRGRRSRPAGGPRAPAAPRRPAPRRSCR